MLSFEACKQTLNKEENKYTDQQISAIRNFLYSLAEIEYLNFKTKTCTDHENSSPLPEGVD
jgi:hypothetical protein